MDVAPTLVPDRQPSEASQPGQRALDDPAIAPQLLAALHAFPGNPNLDVELRQGLLTARHVIGFVCAQLRRSFPWSTTRSSDGLDGVQQSLEVDTVVTIRWPQ